jgi:hypothetical protein
MTHRVSRRRLPQYPGGFTVSREEMKISVKSFSLGGGNLRRGTLGTIVPGVLARVLAIMSVFQHFLRPSWQGTRSHAIAVGVVSTFYRAKGRRFAAASRHR